MRYSVIMGRLSVGGDYAVLAEEYKKRLAGTGFRLWTLTSNFPNKKELKKLRDTFSSFEQHDRLIKLDECSSITAASNILAQARERTSHPAIRQLFLIPSHSKRQTAPKMSYLRSGGKQGGG